MGMVIHDDFWAAAQAMPEKQRAPFIYAIVAYRMEGIEPKGTPAWLPTFIAIKDRIDMGDKSSARARKAANARWHKQEQSKAEAPAEHDAQAYAQHEPSTCEAYAQAQNCNDAEVEVGVRSKEYPPIVPPSFALECLAAFNEIMGSLYGSMPGKCARTLERFSDAYTVDQVRRMIEHKRDEWQGDQRFRHNLTPNTLFSPDHFEQYMHQAQMGQAEEETYAKYD